MPRGAVTPAQRRDDPVANGRTFMSDVAHLMRRAGFGATPAEIVAATRQGLDATIDRLVDYEQVQGTFTPPLDDAIALDKARNVNGLSVGWLNRMLTTNRPLQE